MRHLILGTAGHIDHGKTTLVHALTGTDTDRLPEEKRRGITIDIGFARLDLGDGLEMDIVDVPGHEGFVRNMLAGATGIELALLVIAADEGVMPQTREHFAIIRLLGIARAVVAITKCDLADEDWLGLVEDDVAALLEGTPLAGAPVVRVSARTGLGLEELRRALRSSADDIRVRSATGPCRLPIDRVFTVHGTGTVVTGTLWSGTLRRDDQVRIEPAGLTARVRGLQRHGRDAAEIRAGERGAVALAGIDRDQLRRGDSLLDRSTPWQATTLLTVRLQALAGDGAALAQRQRVRVHLGTAEVMARLVLADGGIAPGEGGLGQLRLEAPVVARAGDRVVIRAYSPVRTIAGAVVLEPHAPRRKRWPGELRSALHALEQPATALAALLEIAGPEGVRLAELPLLHAGPEGVRPAELPLHPGLDGVRREALSLLHPEQDPAAPAGSGDVTVTGDRVTLARFTAESRQRILDSVADFHRRQPIEPGIDRESLRRAGDSGPLFDHALAELVEQGTLVQAGGLLARPEHVPAPLPGQLPVLTGLRELFRSAGLQAPEPTELPDGLAERADLPALLRHLEREGVLVRIAAGRWLDAESLSAAVRALVAQLPAGPPLGIADFRSALGLSRKHLLPLLEYFDAIGLTARTGDSRVLTAPAAMDPDTGSGKGAAPEARP